MPAQKIHVHVWDHENQPNEPLEEYDLILTGEYDDYYQYGAQVGELWIEARIMKDA